MTTTPGYKVTVTDAMVQAALKVGVKCADGSYKPIDCWLPCAGADVAMKDAIEAALSVARAAELTQVTAQSVERASPAKDGGEQDTPYVPNLGEDCRECGYQICRCVDAQHVAADTYIAAVNREFRAAYRKALAVAARPFAKIITESSGRIPTELLSLADWHELSKAMKGIDDAQPLASQMPDSHDAPFEKAWYEISNLLIGNYAQAVSPKEVHEKQVMPKLRALMESQMRPQSAVQGVEPVAWRWWQLMHDSMGGWERKHESSRPPVYVKPEDIRDLEPLYATPAADTAGDQAIPTWAWREALLQWDDGIPDAALDRIESISKELAVAPQPPQGEG